MRTFNIWNQLNLLRNKVSHLFGIAFLLCLLAPASADAQVNAEEFDLKYSKKPYHFGISLGYNLSDFKVRYSENFLGSDSILTARSERGPGFNIGIISNLRLSSHFDLRYIPSLVFAEKRLVYDMIDDNFARKSIESIYIQHPVQIKYKSDPHKDFRMYVIAGMTYTYDLASNARARNAENQVKIGRHDYSVDVGVGMEFYFPYFIFSPEIKMSQGIYNVHSLDPDLQFSNVLLDLFSRAFTISIHFEG